MKYESYFKDELAQIERMLENILPAAGQPPLPIHEAMRYAVLSGGKRFRPVLAMAASEAAGGEAAEALEAACAIELIHAYSLVHDDLPALDNDDLRRGKPTCHRRFGEAVAILAGDGLLTLAFQVLSQIKPYSKAAMLAAEISTSAGTYGMIGGQVADLTASPATLTLPMADYISIHKTGKLIKASAVSGGLAAGASKDALTRLNRYGEALGLAFQFVDDLVDGDGYLKLLKASEIRQKVRDLIAVAKREIKVFGSRGQKLQALADDLLKRIPRGKHVAMDR